MTPAELTALQTELVSAEKELTTQRNKIAEMRRRMAAMDVSDYTFTSPNGGGDVALSSLFNENGDLIVIHNMGKGCHFCTLWADGFNGEYEHLQNRAGFVLVSPDGPEVMRDFADSRGWKFNILSASGTTFFKDMGFESDKGEPWPGVSTFRRQSDGSMRRVSSAPFGPGDDFCGVWPLLDMLHDGANGWEPKYKY